MVKVKQLKLRILAQFLLIIAPITLVLIYQAVADLRRTAAIDSIVQRHSLSQATRDHFESFITHAADAVDTGSLGQRADDDLRAAATSLAALRLKDQRAAALAAQLDELSAQISVAMPVNRLLAHQARIKQLREQIRALDADYEKTSTQTIALSIDSARRQSSVVAAATLFTLLLAAWFMYSMITGVTEPLNAAVDLAGRIAAGHFDAAAGTAAPARPGQPAGLIADDEREAAPIAAGDRGRPATTGISAWPNARPRWRPARAS